MPQVIGSTNVQGIEHSAGSKPPGYVHPLALKTIEEIGISTEGLTRKPIEPFVGKQIDLAITVCDHAKEDCPVLLGVKQALHWPFVDLADAPGTDQQKIEMSGTVRDQIKTKIVKFLKAQHADD